MAWKLAQRDRPKQLTVENKNQTNQHTVTSTRTIQITKRKTKGYIRTCVKEPSKPGRSVLTKNGNRLPHTTLGLCDAK